MNLKMTDLHRNLANLAIDDEEITARHRKERKELQAKIQSLKKTATSDKKKKKEALEEIVRLEADLDRRHDKELAQLAALAANQSATNQSSVDQPAANKIDAESAENADESSTARVSRAQKRRDKKAADEKTRQAEVLAQDELNKTGPRVQETTAIKKLLLKRGLVLQPISSDGKDGVERRPDCIPLERPFDESKEHFDEEKELFDESKELFDEVEDLLMKTILFLFPGNCLYNAIRNQLQVNGKLTEDVNTLRSKTADYILENKDSLIFYMTSAETGDCLDDVGFEKYCSDVRNTPAWGGQVEITALSNVLKAPVEVIQATGPSTIQGEEFKGSKLVITYHRHMYSLGEHYNGTKPVSSGNASDASDDN